MTKYILILGILFVTFNSCVSLECNVKIDNKHINFDGCYNGLGISEVQFENNGNPNFHKFTKITTSEIIVKNNELEIDNSLRKLYFKKPIKGNYQWMCNFQEPTATVSDTLCMQFIPRTWYLFDFHNQSFKIFVFVQDDGSFLVNKIKSPSSF